MNTEINGAPQSIRKRPRRSSGEIDAILRDYEQSGQSKAEFAACHGISLATLRQWIYRRRAKVGMVNQGDLPLSGFVPVRMKTPADDGASSVLIRCPSGHEVVLPGSLGISSLQTLMTTLLKSC